MLLEIKRLNKEKLPTLQAGDKRQCLKKVTDLIILLGATIGPLLTVISSLDWAAILHLVRVRSPAQSPKLQGAEELALFLGLTRMHPLLLPNTLHK